MVMPLSLLQLAAAVAVASSSSSSARAISGSTATRSVFVTVSTLNGTSPRFFCNATTASLIFRPLAASPTARLHAAAGAGGADYCWLGGADAVGEYVVSRAEGQAQLLVIKAVDLDRPVSNLGGEVVFTESWASPRLQDGDASADMWRWRCSAGGAAAKVAGAAALALAPGCTVTSVPHEARTFNLFRHPLTLTVEGVHASAGAARIALAVPSAAAVASTGWPSVRHYLQPLQNLSGATEETVLAGTAASLSVIIGDGVVQLHRRRLTGGPVAVVAKAQLPAGCGHANPATVSLFAGSVFTVATNGNRGGSSAPPLQARLQVFCGDTSLPAANLTADLGLGFLDESGFGESIGEAVLELSAMGHSSPAKSSLTAPAVTIGRIRITNDLMPSFSPAVLAPVTDRYVHTQSVVACAS